VCWDFLSKLCLAATTVLLYASLTTRSYRYLPPSLQHFFPPCVLLWDWGRRYIDEIGLTATDGVREDMEREYEALLMMRHRNIVEFIGTGLFRDQTRFILLEFMAGGSLTELLGSEKELCWEDRVQMCKDAASGMLYIHSMGRIHRDLKSANLLVSELGTVKVADFGQIGDVGRRLGEEDTGTLAWLPPEAHRRLKVTQQSDVYAFGIIMWEVYTRQVPWSHLNDQEYSKLGDRVVAGERPPYPEERLYIERDKRFTDLMQRCWAGSKTNRPSFAHIIEALISIERCVLAPKPRRLRSVEA